MTCIVALRHDKGVTLGADRQGTAGWSPHRSAHPKISEQNGVLVGVSGSIRLAQVIRHELDWDDVTMRLRADDDPHTWAVKKLVPAIRNILSTHAALHTENSVAEFHHSAAIFAVRSRIFELGSDLQVYENAEPYAAIGSGAPVARGSLFSTEWMKDASERCRIALEAAAQWDTGVGGPFDYLEQPTA